MILLDLKIAGRTPGAAGFYSQKLQPFVTFLRSQDITDPAQITPSILRRFLVREEVIDRNPLNKVRTPKVDQESCTTGR